MLELQEDVEQVRGDLNPGPPPCENVLIYTDSYH